MRRLPWILAGLFLTGVFVIFAVGGVGPSRSRSATASATRLPPELSKESQSCVDCHSKISTAVYEQWGASKHYGANVGCYE